jgi:hypothetical protein
MSAPFRSSSARVAVPAVNFALAQAWAGAGPTEPAFQPGAVPRPLMAPNYVFSTPATGLGFTQSWDSSTVTEACYANPDALGKCMDAVVRGGLVALTPIIGTAGAPETLMPGEAAFLSAIMNNAGHARV